MTSHDRLRELVAGHALSALEPEDEQVLLAHLPACAACNRELVAARESAAQLAYAVEPLEPPVSLFAAIRAEVLATSPDAFDVPEAASPLSRRAEDREAVVIPIARHSRFQTRASRLVAVAASVSIAAIVGLGAWNISLQNDKQQQGDISASMQAAIDLIKVSPGQTVPLTGQDGSVDAVAYVHKNGTLDLVTDGITPNDPKKAHYVVWGQTGLGAPRALAAFDIDEAHVDIVKGVTMALKTVPDQLMISREAGQAGNTALPDSPTTLVAQGTSQTA